MGSEIEKPLAGKTALVTGASRGIGKAVALAFARAGAAVLICARGVEALRAAEAELRGAGATVIAVGADVGRAEDVDELMRAARERFGGLDILVNNASLLGPRVAIVEYPRAAWEEVLRVNLTGPFLLIQEALRIMIPRRSGSIINVSSGVGRVGKPRWGAYCASKFALEGLTQMVAEEVREYGVRVNSVNPGPTRTAMRAAAYPEEDPLSLPAPEEIAGVFVYLASDASAAVTGQALEARDWRKTGI
ncbi:MAG TPA: SDR family NAD(P)-dependent oxidoreductase [candidate division Zixibacteria bacterium]|nr:SDR family NAD(P)-dependent oxidoreductase [candidate division Zixibacteria bacterium]